MTTLIEVDITKIDEKIAKAEAELATLKLARSLIAEQAGDSSDAANEQPSDSWYSSLPALFTRGPLTMKEIWEGLRDSGNDVSYGSVYQWMKRAVTRGEYTKRGKKYKPVAGGTDDA
jgi:hypothetical protein